MNRVTSGLVRDVFCVSREFFYYNTALAYVTGGSPKFDNNSNIPDILQLLELYARFTIGLYYVYMILVIVSGEWIELPKLTRQNINPSFTKIVIQEEKTTLANLLELSTTPASISLENEFSDDMESELPYKNQSYTFLDPKLESVLMKAHQVLVEEARHPIKHKLQFLKRLQNNMLGQIWSRSQFLWSADNMEARGHGQMMSFPSLEGALMTISFLTFAVFLIKIVKQFIQGLQGANGNLVGIEIPGAATPAKIIRQKRNIVSEHPELERILQYISEFKMQHKM